MFSDILFPAFLEPLWPGNYGIDWIYIFPDKKSSPLIGLSLTFAQQHRIYLFHKMKKQKRMLTTSSTGMCLSSDLISKAQSKCKYKMAGGRCCGLMVSTLISRLNGPGSSPGWGHCIVSLSKTLHITLTVPLSIQLLVNLMLGVTLGWTSTTYRGKYM